MTKKKKQEEQETFDPDKAFQGSEEVLKPQDEGFSPNSDFDLQDEYKPEPLVPGGNYRGNVIGVVFMLEQNAIVWKVALDNNGGLMSDGETPIDGSHHHYRNWLPKPGDEDEPTKDGRSNKRQSKINMMKRFADGMNINMDTPSIIADALTGQDWVGIPVMITLSINEYMGTTRNQIDKMINIEE